MSLGWGISLSRAGINRVNEEKQMRAKEWDRVALLLLLTGSGLYIYGALWGKEWAAIVGALVGLLTFFVPNPHRMPE